MGVHDAGEFFTIIRNPSWSLVTTTLFLTTITAVFATYLFLRLVAHIPRPEIESERYYTTPTHNGREKRLLPSMSDYSAIDGIEMSVVIPAYNEELRIELMLDEAVEVLNSAYPDAWEILIVDDGSSDGTTEKVLNWAQRQLVEKKIKEGEFRICQLARNRGKGGAVTHGMRHIRGSHAIFADADGATKFSDVLALQASLSSTTSLAIGSRAHMVKSSAVVQRSFMRNLLMHGFHLFLRFLGIRTIQDTQCGFKLFKREAIDRIFPYMHCEGWIFDIEILMLAEKLGFGMAEVPVTWHEVAGTKMSLVKDSIMMAWDLIVLRGAYSMGIYVAS